MDGPEDCGKPQGDGKNGGSKDSKGSTSLLNTWVLEGLTSGSGGSFTCTPSGPENPEEGQDNCELSPIDPPSCDNLKEKPDTITWRYTGGTDPDDQCDSSTIDDERYRNKKGKIHEDFRCSGSVNPSQSVVVSYKNGGAQLRPGESFTLKRDDSKKITLRNSGTQSLEFHTSCSQPLVVGATAGALTLVGLGGQTISNDVTYIYTVENTGTVPALNVIVTDDKLGKIGSTIDSLGPGGMKTFTKTVPIEDDTTNVATVTGETSGGTSCTDTDSVTVTVL
jgi:hypothetical protein